MTGTQPKQKDAWDKFELMFKLLVLGLVPIVIGIAANHIAQSIERGKFISSLIEELSDTNAKRDIALIALDDTMPVRKKCLALGLFMCSNDLSVDPVVRISGVLIDESIKSALETKRPEIPKLLVARDIISGEKRGDGTGQYYKLHFGDRIERLERAAQSEARSEVDSANPPTPEKIERQENIAQIIAAVQPLAAKPTEEDLSAVRLVYIQYGSDKELAEKIQGNLTSKGVSAPGIEQVDGVLKNDIRYANPTAKAAAQKIKAVINMSSPDIEFAMIDLSKAGYRVPTGQFEVWVR